MKHNNWLLIATGVILFSSCGESSTKKSETETDTASTTPTTTVTDTNTTTPVTTSITVPDPIQTTFRQKYPDVKDVTWSRHQPQTTSNFDWEWSGWPMLDTGDYMAKWNWDNTDYWAWYDSDNNWVGTVSNVTDFSSLPAPVNKVITGQYAGYSIVSVDRENDRNRTAYEIDLAKGEDKMVLLIDENGKVIKKKSLTDGQRTKEKQQQ